ncbi:MAG: FkbM family methyltransferase [Thermoleophilaceae bacterium]
MPHLSFRAALARARKLVAILKNPVYRRALRHGSAAAVEHEAVPFRHIFRTIIDVGSSRGQFALVAAHRFPEAALICFEPLPGPRRKLESALGRHGNLTVIDRAVSSDAGTAEFVVSRADDSSSLLEMTATQTHHFPGTEAARHITVRTEPLDEMLTPGELAAPLLLKVDVQGAEIEVLRGAERVLPRVDSILVECSFLELYRGQALAGEVVAFLHEHGFRLDALCSPTVGREGRVLQADLLFERTRAGSKLDEPTPLSGDRGTQP